MFPQRFTSDFLCSCWRRDVQNNCLQCAGGPEGRLASKATEMSAPCSAQRRLAPPSALRCADPTRPLCVRVLDSTGSKWMFLDMPCMRRVTETNRRRYTGQQPGTKSASRPGDKPVVHRRFCSSIGLHRISLVRASIGSPRMSSFHRLGVRDFVFSCANNPVVGVLCCPSPPGSAVPPGAAPYRPARGMSGFWTRQVLNTN